MNLENQATRAVLGIVSQFWVSRGLIAAANLGIADVIGGEPTTVEEIAASLDIDSECLYRLMRSLAAYGVFQEVDGRRFRNTEKSSILRQSDPYSVRDLIRSFGFNSVMEASAELESTVRTGRSALEREGLGYLDRLAQDPEKSAVYHSAMDSASAAQADAILNEVDFSEIKQLADIGGGQGSLLARILAANPGQRGILFDLPSVVSGSARVLERHGVTPRCTVHPGDFRVAVPEGCDGYVLKHILHGWSDENARDLLQRIHRASAPRAKLFVIEMLMSGPNVLDPSKSFDLFMLLGGRETRVRTGDEFQALFASAGFELTRVVNTRLGISIVEGRRR